MQVVHQRPLGVAASLRGAPQINKTIMCNIGGTPEDRRGRNQMPKALAPTSVEAPFSQWRVDSGGKLMETWQRDNEKEEGSLPDYLFEAPLTPIDPREVGKTTRAIILAGGETNNPLTRYRALPAVPFGSSLRLVDIPLNNCLKAGINKIYVLTQFQSHALNSHITSSYPPVRFAGPDGAGWVDLLAAQQTTSDREWYRGSADALRRNIEEFKDEDRGVANADDYFILSGAGVYNIDFGRVLAYHRSSGADLTICTHLVDETTAPTKGIATIDPISHRVTRFDEKPAAKNLERMRHADSSRVGKSHYLANMGIYVFSKEALFELLAPSGAGDHIGHHVIPGAIAQGMRVQAYRHEGSWRDVSMLKDYMEANLALARDECPQAQLQVQAAVAAAKGRILPPVRCFGSVNVSQSLVDDGSVLVDCTVRDSVVGECMYVGEGSVVEHSLLLGSPMFSGNIAARTAAEAAGERVFGVGRNCILKNCILDKNASIGDGCVITNSSGVKEADHSAEGWQIQDGIVVVLRNAVIPPGTVI